MAAKVGVNPKQYEKNMGGTAFLDLKGNLQRYKKADGLDSVHGSLAGLSGAPALDSSGRVIGVTIAEAPRRGRIYTTDPSAIREALAAAKQTPPTDAAGEPITTDNYGRVADSLRRELRVAQVVCLTA